MSSFEDEEDESPVKNKKYCCGNLAIGETKLISKLDVVSSILVLVGIGIVWAVWLSSPAQMCKWAVGNEKELLKSKSGWKEKCFEMVKNSNTVFGSFIVATIPEKLLLSLAVFIFFTGQLILATCLHKRCLKMEKGAYGNTWILLLWRKATLTVMLIIVCVTTYLLLFYSRKDVTGLIGTIYFLYKWYAFWIAGKTMDELEIKHEEDSSTNPVTEPLVTSDF